MLEFKFGEVAVLVKDKFHAGEFIEWFMLYWDAYVQWKKKVTGKYVGTDRGITKIRGCGRDVKVRRHFKNLNRNV